MEIRIDLRMASFNLNSIIEMPQMCPHPTSAPPALERFDSVLFSNIGADIVNLWQELLASLAIIGA